MLPVTYVRVVKNWFRSRILLSRNRYAPLADQGRTVHESGLEIRYFGL
jgi:hypothetical protein